MVKILVWWQDQKLWIIGAIILSIWAVILGILGYQSEDALRVVFIILMLLVFLLSKSNKRALLVIGFLFSNGWFCISTCGYFLSKNQHGSALITGFLALFLQTYGFLYSKRFFNS